MPDYLPVPVEAAKEIAERYSKAMVVILCWDTEHHLLHTTTYGRSALEKQNAAAVGEICTRAVGADMSEDFPGDLRPALLKEAEEIIAEMVKTPLLPTVDDVRRGKAWLERLRHNDRVAGA